MEATTRPGTLLRRRMLEDMRMRKMAEHTQEGYVRAVRKRAALLGRSPDTATVEELRLFQLHLVDAGAGPVTIKATITGLKFFFDITLGKSELMAKMQPERVPRTLPVVLSREEAARLIAAAPNLKHQAALSVAYGAGLRASEVIGLKVTDVDSQRMTLRVEQGKGRKDRYAMLSPVLLERLRAWWRLGQAQGKILPGGWLFPGLDPMDPLTSRQLNRAVHSAADAAKIDKRVSTHTPRHYSACRNIPSELGCAQGASGKRDILRLVRSAYPWSQSDLRNASSWSSGLNLPLRPSRGLDPFERCLLDLEIGVEIDLRHLDRFVPQQQGNDSGLHPGLKQFHRRGASRACRHPTAPGLLALTRAQPAIGQDTCLVARARAMANRHVARGHQCSSALALCANTRASSAPRQLAR